MRTAIVAALVMSAACAAPSNGVTPDSYHLIPGSVPMDRGPDGNSIFLDAPDGLILVDTGRHPAHAAKLIDYARDQGRPIAAIVNTHWHLDHTTGNYDIRQAYPVFLTGRLFARGRAARRRIAELQSRTHALLGKPTLGERISSVLAMGFAGCTETPLVVVDSQRAGPSTGLPTRTEQGDLLFVLHASHGEWPRIVLTPGTIEECFWAGVRAFSLAEKYQTPVIIMQDLTQSNAVRTVPKERFDFSQITIDRGKHTGAKAGRVLYGPGTQHR